MPAMPEEWAYSSTPAIWGARRSPPENVVRERVLATALVALVGCGEAIPLEDAGIDASAPQDATSPEDAGGHEPDTGTDAGPACEAGDTRAVECGNCGLAMESCSAGGVWEATSECLGEGECAAGEVEREGDAMCLERSRICDEACAWRPWTATRPAGECEAGETRTLTDGCSGGETRTEVCSAECAWVEDTPCSDACVGIRRSAPWDSEEICIPNGPFMRGNPGQIAATPVREVQLSSYYIDRYPVTNERYRGCVAAGICRPAYGPDYSNPAKATHPVHGVSWDDAVAFCAWDGARRLPTEAEWEKAGRGPSPSELNYPWGTWECEHIDFRTCGWAPADAERDLSHDDVTAYPLAASSYGVEMLVGGVRQWVSDWYGGSYYGESGSYVDPRGPASGTSRSIRGAARADTRVTLYYRRAYEPVWQVPLVGFRCARDGE